MLILGLCPPIAVNIVVLFEQDSDLAVELGQLHHLLKLGTWVSDDSGTKRCGAYPKM